MQRIRLTDDDLATAGGLLWVRLPTGGVACFDPTEATAVPSPIGPITVLRLEALVRHEQHWCLVGGTVIQAKEGK